VVSLDTFSGARALDSDEAPPPAVCSRSARSQALPA